MPFKFYSLDSAQGPRKTVMVQLCAEGICGMTPVFRGVSVAHLEKEKNDSLNHKQVRELHHLIFKVRYANSLKNTK